MSPPLSLLAALNVTHVTPLLERVAKPSTSNKLLAHFFALSQSCSCGWVWSGSGLERVRVQAAREGVSRGIPFQRRGGEEERKKKAKKSAGLWLAVKLVRRVFHERVSRSQVCPGVPGTLALSALTQVCSDWNIRTGAGSTLGFVWVVVLFSFT